MITFNDLFKSSFLEKVSSFSALDMILAMGLALVVGLFIFLVYKKTFNGVMYSQSFGVSLIGMTLVTTLIILAVNSNVVLSLGMVGALSIVRFRTAIKEPIDIVFLFWAISAGIVLGAGLIPLAVFGSVFIGVILLVLVNQKSRENPYILVLNCENDQAERQAVEQAVSQVRRYSVKSKTVSQGNVELTMEVRLQAESTALVNALCQLPGVRSAVLVSYNGEYMS